jgi:hypothetical protein
MDNGKLNIENHKLGNAVAPGRLTIFFYSGVKCLFTLLFGMVVLLSTAYEARVQASVLATGKVTGRITVAGGYPTSKALPVFKNRSFCGSQVANETLLIGRDGGLKNTVVIIRPLDRRAPAQPKSLILDNQRCAFVPHVQVAPVGSELLLKNSDPILHTVHARLGRETLFNIGLPKWRQVTKRLDRSGVVRIDCDVLHTWMSAAIVVTASPHYALSDENGYFFIEGLTAGVYGMEVWHEKLGGRAQTLRLDDGDWRTVDVVFSTEHIR